jgi:large subunit ribosomal protein L23
MNNEKVLKTLLAQIVSEKTTSASANNQYSFRVRIDSNKREVRSAIESLFGVSVLAVQTSVVKGKTKMTKGRKGRRVNWKKATVKLAEGQMIDISSNN